VDDKRLAVGSEAMGEARQVYDYVKSAVKATPGLKPVADQLAGGSSTPPNPIRLRRNSHKRRKSL
jgi:hypothetical protein